MNVQLIFTYGGTSIIGNGFSSIFQNSHFEVFPNVLMMLYIITITK